MEDLRHCEEFYNLMQTYRHTPVQQDVRAAFEAVIAFIEDRAEKQDELRREIEREEI